MELLKIEMENFRQFYGQQSVEFSTGNNNITIVIGENGMGKTGIFRALMFGLYGSRYLPQDNKNDEIHLVNMKSLDSGTPITSIVKVHIGTSKGIVIVKRSIKGVKYNNKITEDQEEVSLDLISPDGDYKTDYETDKFRIEAIINGILDEKIKEFFLFDGEKIETLARTDKAVKEEVKTGIVKLMQIDKLEKGITIVNSILRKESEKIKDRSANIDLHNKEKQVKEKEKEIESKEEIMKLKKENISALKSEIEDIKSKLDENKEIRELNKVNEGYQKEKSNVLEKIKIYKESINNSIMSDAQKLLMQDYFKGTKEDLKQLLLEQKDLVPFEIIEKSLDSMYCVCCDTSLEGNNHAIDYLENLKRNHSRSEHTIFMRFIVSRIEEFENKKDDINNDIKYKLDKISTEKQELLKVDRKIEDLRDAIKGFSQKEEDLRILESSLAEKEKQMSKLEIEIENLESILKQLAKELNILNREFDALLKKSAENEYEARRLEIIQNLGKELKEIFDDYSSETRNILGEETTRIFRRLIDDKDMSLINEIRINNKYELEIVEGNNIRITQDISQGQRQIVALSFVTALAKIADKGSGQIEFPLFMDTPFGRISQQNRVNLIRNIPNLSLQWILLLTDTEFTDFEAEAFRTDGRVGKIYKLFQLDKGHSEIRQMNVSEYLNKGANKWIS